MFFFRGPQYQAGRRQFVFRAATLAASLLVGTAALSGCGGSGGGSTSATPTPTPTTTVTGRFIDNNTSANIAGVVVTFGSLTVTTGSDGQFSFTVPTTTTATTLTATFPKDSSGNSQYYSTVYIHVGSVLSQVNIVNTGISINVAGGDSPSIGDIRAFNQSDPPPPPLL